MTNVTVSTVGKIFSANKSVVRTSSDRVYVVATDSAFTSVDVFKGNQNGEPTSFSNVASLSNLTGLFDEGACIAIDSSDIIHIIYYQFDSAMSGIQALRYVTFDTSTDSFGTPEDVATINNDATFLHYMSIAIDVNDKPHVAWRDAITAMGSTNRFNYYSNKTGASWRSPVTISSTANDTDYVTDILIADPLSSVNADRPILIESINLTQLNAYYGDALDATSFTSATDIAGKVPVGATQRIAIDSGEKIIISFCDFSTLDLYVVEHLNSSTWSTWETPSLIDSTNNYSSKTAIAVDGTDIYVFSADTSSDIRLWKNTGSGWSQETADADLPNTGTFSSVCVKWSRYNNNTPKGLDYVFQDSGGSILYNTFAISTITAYVLADSIGFSDAINKVRNVPALAESFGGSESVSIGKDTLVTDGISYSDITVTIKDIIQNDLFNGIESVLFDKEYILNESSNFSENILKSVVFALSDSESFSDSIFANKGLILTDTLNNSEQVFIDKELINAESIIMSDATVTQKSILLTEMLTFSDALEYVREMFIAEGINFSDALVTLKDIIIGDQFYGKAQNTVSITWSPSSGQGGAIVADNDGYIGFRQTFTKPTRIDSITMLVYRFGALTKIEDVFAQIRTGITIGQLGLGTLHATSYDSFDPEIISTFPGELKTLHFDNAPLLEGEVWLLFHVNITGSLLSVVLNSSGQSTPDGIYKRKSNNVWTDSGVKHYLGYTGVEFADEEVFVNKDISFAEVLGFADILKTDLGFILEDSMVYDSSPPLTNKGLILPDNSNMNEIIVNTKDAILPESISFSDNGLFDKAYILSDLFFGNESIIRNKIFTLIDNFTGSEVIKTVKEYIISGSIHFSDTILIVKNFILTDNFSGNEIIIKSFAVKLSGVFSAIENIFAHKNFVEEDTFSGSEDELSDKEFILLDNMSFVESVIRDIYRRLGVTKVLILRQTAKPKLLRRSINAKLVRTTGKIKLARKTVITNIRRITGKIKL